MVVKIPSFHEPGGASAEENIGASDLGARTFENAVRVVMVISLVLGVLPAPFRHRSDSAQQPHPEQQIWSRIPGQLPPVAPTDSEIYTSSAFERAWTGGAVAKEVAGRRVSIGVRSWT